MVDTLVGNVSDGLQMYRRWSCGNWLMPRLLPTGVFPTCIVRREGELGVTLTSEIEVGMLFATREKPPKELRLTIIFRDRIRAYSKFQPVIHNNSEEKSSSMTVSFNETFYLAVPNLGKKEELGELFFYLEEPSHLDLNKSALRKFFSDATVCARRYKKKVSAFIRKVSKKWGNVVRVAACDRPLRLRFSDFNGDGSSCLTRSTCLTSGKNIIDKTVPMITCSGKRQLIGKISLKLCYSAPPKSTGTEVSKTPIAMINEGTPKPQLARYPYKMKSISFVDTVKYEVMNGTDLFKADGFVDNMFDLVEKVYEGDPLGPTKESSLDAPPVNCVRSIYGINIPTEAGAIYRCVEKT